MKNILLLLVILPMICLSQAQYYMDYIPSSTTGQVIHHKYYSLSYSEDHETAEWTIYHLSNERMLGTVSRTNNFRSDPLVNTGSANLSDYKGSGYDRGHLVPATDMSFDTIAMSESFYLSNIALQEPWLNRVYLKGVEAQIRTWASKYDSLIIITGVVFLDSNDISIGNSNVAVPSAYYKVVIDIQRLSGIAFVFPFGMKRNLKDDDLQTFLYSIDELEELTGVNFLKDLDNPIQDSIEGKVKVCDWFSVNKTIVEKKAALVIGNEKYRPNKNELVNPVNDAKLIRKTLDDIGADTILFCTNIGLDSMNSVFKEFYNLSAEYDISIIYFAGHGIQDNFGNSYLVPVDYKHYLNPDSLKEFSLSLNKKLKLFTSNQNKILCIIDACRETWNDGFGNSPKLENLNNVKIIFSTSYGRKASDNPNNKNSFFTEELSKNFYVKDNSVDDVFRQTRNKVYSKSFQKQIPRTYGWIPDDLILFPSSEGECK